jgi:hypothetical protein
MSCKNKKSSENKVADVTKTETETASQDAARDSAAIRQQVMSFYEWYVKNDKALNGFALYRSKVKQDQPPYEINWAEVNKLNDYIRSSVPYLGEEFIRNQKRLLEQADSAFKVDLEDDIPYGFDYDWYTNTQEDPGYLLDELKKAKRWVIVVNGDNATADIKVPFNDNGTEVENTLIKLSLKKEGNTWKIAKIGMDQ